MSIYEYSQGVIDAVQVTQKWPDRFLLTSKTHVLRAFIRDLQVIVATRNRKFGHLSPTILGSSLTRHTNCQTAFDSDRSDELLDRARSFVQLLRRGRE